MADVTNDPRDGSGGCRSRSDWRADEPAPASDEDRAQLILITGLALAVILVAVVLLLNTAIYSENLATRGVDAGGAEAVDFRDGTVDDVAAIMHREHRNESTDAAPDDFEASAAVYANAIADLRARDGVIADVRAVTNVTGHFVAQDELDDGSHRNMTDAAGTESWVLASNVTRTRNYHLTVDSASLDGPDSFVVVTERPNATWTMSLSNGADDAIDVTVNNGTHTVSETFEHAPGENVTIDVTGGTVNGDPFPALVWAEHVQNGTVEYDLRYENGDAVAGTYHFVVDQMDTPSNEQYGDPPSDRSSQPYVVDAVYSADVAVSHRTPELEYADVIRVAPGERDA